MVYSKYICTTDRLTVYSLTEEGYIKQSKMSRWFGARQGCKFANSPSLTQHKSGNSIENTMTMSTMQKN